jgi:hypothetical protein
MQDNLRSCLPDGLCWNRCAFLINTGDATVPELKHHAADLESVGVDPQPRITKTTNNQEEFTK